MRPETTIAVIELGWLSLVLLAIPVAVAVGLSIGLKLGLAGRITWAMLRAVVQLVAVGLVIGYVFAAERWYWVVALLVAMTLVAGFTGAAQLRRHVGALRGVLSLVLGGVTAMMLLFFGKLVIGVDGWDPRYLIPIGGMLLGNAMTAATLAAERVAADTARDARDVEAMLALGASPWQAMRPAYRAAVGAALTPTINAMLLVGVVKLPGMMTGQMLGGSPPFDAAMYQLLILVGILICDLLCAVAIGAWVGRRLFSNAWQLDRAALGATRNGSRR